MEEKDLKREFPITLTGEEIVIITQALSSVQDHYKREIATSDGLIKACLIAEYKGYVCATDEIGQKFADALGIDLEEEE
jgi:hypothetical protein